MKGFANRIRNIEYANEKLRFLVFAVALFLILFLARYLLGLAFSRYEIRAKINANIDRALYIFEDTQIRFNLEPNGIVPRNEPYVYRFSVSNYNDSKQSDVDISYNVQVRTTTNLPITVRMYRNEIYYATGATNIFSGGSVAQQDEDDAWYRLYQSIDDYEFYYTDQTTDVYTMVIDFPTTYASNTVYANYIESIEVILNSEQII